MRSHNASALLVAFMMVILAIFASCAYNVRAQTHTWTYATFEENIGLSYSPAIPNSTESVRVTLEGKEGQPITGANMYYTWTAGGSQSQTGGGKFNAINTTTMYYDIRGYVGGTVIRFYVTAWDSQYNQITSMEYNYTVAKNGSWLGTSFEEDASIVFTPANPDFTNEVVVRITPKNDLQLAWAMLNVTYQIGSTISSGNPYFEMMNETAWLATIPRLPAGANVSFRVYAADAYGERRLSEKHNYTVYNPENPNPLVFAHIAVVVIDDFQRKYVEGANVTFINETWTFSTKTTLNGVADVMPYYVFMGNYTIVVKYRNETQTKNLTITPQTTGAEAIIEFRFSTELPIIYKMESYPPLELIFAYVLMALGAVFFFAAYKSRSALECSKEISQIKDGANEEKQAPTELLARISSYKPSNPTFAKMLDRIRDQMAKEKASPDLTKPVAFFALGLFGALFAPFYPWYMVLTIGIVTAIISYKYPYLAMIVLSFAVIGSTAYQRPEFGFVFMVFALVVSICSFFKWEFGYFVYLTIFASRLGLGFAVPALAAILYTTFLGIAVGIVAYSFVYLLVSCSNLSILGYFVGAQHRTAFMVFSKPVRSDFNPGMFIDAMNSLNVANNEIITMVFSNVGISIVPVLELLLWCLGIYVVGKLCEQIIDTKMKTPRKFYMPWLKMSCIASLILVVSSLASLLALGYSDLASYLPVAGLFAATYFATGLGILGRIVYSPFYAKQSSASGIGTRVADMTLAKTSFGQVGGLTDVKSDIKESIVVPLLRPDISLQFGIDPPKGILLFGPPGCGKTMLMKALASELNVDMIAVKCSDVMSKWYGESEVKMAELFREAKERKPCILFLDEIDAIAKRRDLYAADDVTPRLLSIMLSELDGMDKSTGIVIVATTNKPEMVDPALMRPGRFDKIMYVPPPDLEERMDILAIHLANKPADDTVELEDIAKRTERFSGADLANLVKEAATLAMRRSMDTNTYSEISKSDFDLVLSRVKPSITLKMKEDYEKLKLDFERKIHDVARSEQRHAIKWDRVAGLAKAKKVLRENIELPLNGEVAEKFKMKGGRGILLFGPPSCGKTYLMRATSSELGMHLEMMNGLDLLSSTQEFSMKDAFTRAKENAPSVVFMDDIDTLISGAYSNDNHSADAKKLLSGFLNEMDALKSSDKVVVCAASTHPAKIDKSMLRTGRFEVKIFISPPDESTRAQIFEQHLADLPVAEGIDIKVLAKKTEGYGAGDIPAIVEEAKLIAIRSLAAHGGPTGNIMITMDALLEAIGKVRSSITREAIESSLEFMKKNGLG